MRSKINLSIALIVLLCIILVLALNSCSVLKTKQELKKDSTSLNKQDTGKVSSSSSTNSNETKWYKETYLFDTTIIKNNYYTQPTVIIREGGSNNLVNSKSNYDSSWGRKIDSLKFQIEESSKKKDENAFSFWGLIGVAAVCIAISVLLSKLKISIK